MSGGGSADLLGAIRRAGGAPKQKVTRGAVDAGGRIAWIEEPHDVARLFVAAHGRVLVNLELATGDTADWGYEGCSVGHLAWHGEHVVAIAVEEKHTVVWSVTVPGADAAGVLPAVERLPIGQAHVVDGDLVVWAGEWPNLLDAATLPSLAARTPLPLRGSPRYLRLALDDGQVRVKADAGSSRDVQRLTLPTASQRDFPDDRDAFLDLVAHRLFEARAIPPLARLLIEATALPFCVDRRRERIWRPRPVWVPVYWYRHLVSTGDAAAAREMLALFDTIAALLPDSEPERGWDPAWDFLDGAVTLATRHVRRQARVQASACRAGELPVGWWCLLFYPAVGSDEVGSRIDPTALPPTLRRAFETLVPTRPAELPHRY